MKPFKVALVGIGTVGSGVFKVLQRNQAEIKARTGRGIEITVVADRNVNHARSIVGDGAEVVDDAFAAVARPDVDVVVELIGGYTVAKDLVLKAIENGKHVVTANKALLAVHGTEIFEAAQQKGVMVAFEAAVAGGIPIIKALREGLTANRIQWLAGIINGTTNFILSEMRDKGLDFDVVLKEAQRLGYAEADPTFDIEGVDAAHKATIMNAIAFGIPVQFDKAYMEGITQLASTDIKYAEQLGYRIKLLGIAKRREEPGSPQGVELRVHPTLVPSKRLIANVEGAQLVALMGHSEVCYCPDKAAKDERKYRRHNGFKKVAHHLPPSCAARAASILASHSVLSCRRMNGSRSVSRHSPSRRNRYRAASSSTLSAGARAARSASTQARIVSMIAFSTLLALRTASAPGVAVFQLKMASHIGSSLLSKFGNGGYPPAGTLSA